jgi:hypothetical protein
LVGWIGVLAKDEAFAEKLAEPCAQRILPVGSTDKLIMANADMS